MAKHGRSALTVGVVAVCLAGCSGGVGTAATGKAGWVRQHGAAVSAVNQELDQSRTALAAGDRQSILGACTLLRDDVDEAKKGLPVPEVNVDAALQRALNATGVAADDCLSGARVASNASLNEKAMRELATARSQMDTADQALAAWQ
jgi:hypothetical protein